MGLVPHHALVTSTAPFVTAFETIFTHGAWAGKLVAALAVVSGIWNDRRPGLSLRRAPWPRRPPELVTSRSG